MVEVKGYSLKQTKLVHLSYDGNFQLEHSACILRIDLDDDGKVTLVIDETVFHPQGGGQPGDCGQIKAIDGASKFVVRVESVKLDRSTGLVLHSGKLLNTESQSCTPFMLGEEVQMKVDSIKRQELSECHTAGHVVDAAMEKCGLCLPPTKGYHFLDGPYVEYRGTIPASDRAPLLEKLKQTFTALLEEDIPTKIEVMDKTAADGVCNRKAKNFDFDSYKDDEPIRVVTVAGYPCPCGGTHVRSTSALKKRAWNLTGIKCKKGVVRIKYNSNINKK